MTAPIPKHDRMFAKRHNQSEMHGIRFNAVRGILVGLCLGSALWVLIIGIIGALV